MAEKTSKADNFSDEEKAAMKQRAAETRARRSRKGEEGRKADLDDVLAAIDKLEGLEKTIAQGLHEIVTSRTDLAPKTWYGFPSYARDGKVVVFYQPGSKFKVRYGTVSFDVAANLDEGDMWPVSFAVVEWNDAVAERVTELVEKAA